jgi:outer membrane protein assembly factor BamB
MTSRLRGSFAITCAFAAALGLTGCGSGLPSIPGVSSLFEETEVPLPGERISVLSSDTTAATAEVESKEPIVLPAPQQNASWSQPGGVASNAPGHLAFAGSGATVWSGDAGSGSDSDGRVIALPIIHNGKVFTLDREGQVSAFSFSGSRIWRVDLTPEDEKSRSGFGGGLAADGNQLFVTTGFGTVVALSIDGGKQNWTKKLGVPIRSSPTVANGRVFVVNTDSELYALSVETGDEIWRSRGLPESAVVLSNVSPAVSGDTLVVSYPSGEIAALKADTGEPRWTDSVSGGIVGSTLTTIGDAARPVIAEGVVYAGNRSGRLLATQLASGERVWSRDIRAAQTPCVAGDAVFVVDTNKRLYGLDRKTGKVRWVSTLPEARTWSGPTLAGGKLWLASNAGLLVGVDAKTGQVATKRELDDAVYISPVVASGRMFVLTDEARLIAMN